MQDQLKEIAQRIKALREIMEIPVGELARENGVTAEEYLEYESGEKDFTFTFLYNCAQLFGVDIIELLTGEKPRLSFYSIVRKDAGLKINRRKGFTYNHLAYRFSDKTAEPFLVTAPFFEEEQDQPIHLSTHDGQEFDYVLKGQLKVQMEDHVEYLEAGDAIYYDSGHGHGMIATGGEECVFLAIVMRDQHERGERD
ncbi:MULTISPECIES: helix-turn-helix domain-containing protein [Anaerotruncus]|jgi:quercetin dioxygenase-like cupin family protein|uniref:helix-turn-helix domain-containing protein n=1 Tax=Anaerotruncus TaxID=244127 RepID=UPI000829D608|nr:MULTISPECIES: cupin domain-containing protein [Anaerotruncus]RGX55808.1 XRE family transcriptional regulator [Anaerotruncus sp. AF02-27]